MPRRMAASGFREAQWQHRYDEHIAPINRLVDSLHETTGGWLPYVAPMYGGVGARLLSLLRDPGPKTQTETGSGFLCMENDDPTAEAISNYFSAVRIHAEDIIPWNVYPWYMNRAPKAAELNIGVDPLRQLIGLLPKLSVVMVHGTSAQDGWRRFVKRHGDVLATRRIHVIETYHTSPRAFIGGPEVRAARREHLRMAFAEAARLLDI